MMLNKSENNNNEDKEDIQIDKTVNRKIVVIKRTVRMNRQNPKEARTNTEDDRAGGTIVPKEITTHVDIPHTFSFDDGNVYNKFSGTDGRHKVRMVWIQKRKADQDKDSTELRDYRKRIKLDEDENVTVSSKNRNNSNSSFQPDYDLIISWL